MRSACGLAAEAQQRPLGHQGFQLPAGMPRRSMERRGPSAGRLATGRPAASSRRGEGGSDHVAWRCLRTTKVRASWDRASQRIGVVERGEVVHTSDVREDELGRPQLHLSRPLSGWASEVTTNGDVAFCLAELDDFSSEEDLPPASSSRVVSRRRVSPRRTTAEEFVCRNRAPLRLDFDMLSERAGFVERGAVIRVLESRMNERGQRQLRCDDGWVMEHGWTGTRMFEPRGGGADADELSSDGSEEAELARVAARELQRRRAPSPARHRSRSRSRSRSPQARRPQSAGRERAGERSAGGRSVSAGRSGRRRSRRLTALGSELSDTSGDESSVVKSSQTEARAREYIAGMLTISGAVNDGHVDKSMAMAADGGLINPAQRSRVKKLTGRAKLVTAFNILTAAGSSQRRRGRGTAAVEPQPARRKVSPGTQRRFVSRMQDDAHEREDYREQMRQSVELSQRSTYIDQRAQDDLLARMDARQQQRDEELELYRRRPDLVDPDLVFQPTINRGVPSTARRISPARSPMRRAESRHLQQRQAARARAESVKRGRGKPVRRPRSPTRTNSPVRAASPVLLPPGSSRGRVVVNDDSEEDLRDEIIELFRLHNPAKLESVDALIEKVSFQWKNPDFLFRSPDFLLKIVEFIIKRSTAQRSFSSGRKQST